MTTIETARNIHLELPQFLLSDFLVLAKFLILGLVDQNDPVSLEERLREQSLGEGRESGLDEGQVDAVDGNVVTGGAHTGCLASAVDGDRTWDVTDGDAVAVLLNLQFLFIEVYRQFKCLSRTNHIFFTPTL